MAITSNVHRLLFGDYLLPAWKSSGLIAPSVVTGVIRTVKSSMITKRLGRLASADLAAVEQRLKQALGLLP